MTDRHAQDDDVSPAEAGSDPRARPGREVPLLAKLFQQEGWQLEGVSFGESVAEIGTGDLFETVVEATASNQEVPSSSIPEPAPTQAGNASEETTVVDVATSPAAVIRDRGKRAGGRLETRSVGSWIRKNPALASILPKFCGASDGREIAAREVGDLLQPFRQRIVEHVKQNPAATVVLAVVLIALGLVRFAGSDGGAEVADLVSVSGTVSVDGEPLEDGIISFVSTEGGRTVAAKIADGRYSLPRNAGPVLGPQKVLVNAFRKFEETKDAVADGVSAASGGTLEAVPADAPSGSASQPVQFLPERYNSQTTLRAELKSTVNKHVSFDLEAH